MFESAADNSSILSIDLGLLIGLLVLRRLLDPLLTRDRILFGLTTGSLLIMYSLWRWHDTLPTFAFSVQNLWQYFFFAFEALAIVYTLMSIVILFRNILRKGLAGALERFKWLCFVMGRCSAPDFRSLKDGTICMAC
jgi:cellulose synthase (UDP-forming)